MGNLKEILLVLPVKFRTEATRLFGEKKVEELRLRGGQVLHYVDNNGEYPLKTDIIRVEDLDFVVARASEYSVHTVREQIVRGYITMSGGHRLGLCGSGVMEGGRIVNLRRISSISIRVAQEYRGISAEVLPKIKYGDSLYNTIVVSSPGCGKTTLLRDLVRSVSSGIGIKSQRVGLVDERSEIAGLCQGIPTFDLGSSTDILEGCSKSLGMVFLLRSMNPQILAVDEITSEEDVKALSQVVGCGVKLLVTAHGKDKCDLFVRSSYRRLMDLKIFEKIILIQQHHGQRKYVVEDLLC